MTNMQNINIEDVSADDLMDRIVTSTTYVIDSVKDTHISGLIHVQENEYMTISGLRLFIVDTPPISRGVPPKFTTSELQIYENVEAEVSKIYIQDHTVKMKSRSLERQKLKKELDEILKTIESLDKAAAKNYMKIAEVGKIWSTKTDLNVQEQESMCALQKLTQNVTEVTAQLDAIVLPNVSESLKKSKKTFARAKQDFIKDTVK